MTDALPFWDIHEPIARLLMAGHGRTRHTLRQLAEHSQRDVAHRNPRTMVRTIGTPAGRIEMRTLNDGTISASLIMSRELDFAQRDVVMRTMALPDTVLVACVGMRLRDVADPGPGFPARDATIIAARRVVRTTRLTIDVPRMDIGMEDVATGSR